jgi:Flp pilus assembly protein TadD
MVLLAPPAETIATCKAALAFSPSAQSLHIALSEAHFRAGDWQEALREAQLDPDPKDAAGQLALVHARRGDVAAARAELAKFADDPLYEVDIALVHAMLGEMDAAFRYLDRAKARDATEVRTIAALPRFRQAFGKDPRWHALVASVGRDEASLAKVKFELKLPG